MNDFDPIILNSNWLINGAHSLPSLVDCHLDLAEDVTVELQKMFELEPIGEVCLRFFLHIEAAPNDTTVTMNGWDVGKVSSGQPMVADVTDFVTLEDNVLLLIVNQKGRFGEVWLARVPCEAD
jgi:hypothetical protein